MQLFYTNPNRSFYVREITRKIDEQINSVRRELANLLSIGIISSEDDNTNKLYYEVDQTFEYYDALSAIFGTKRKTNTKTLPAKSEDRSEITSVGNVELAILTGQFTRDESAGIDLLIVGDTNHTKVQKYVEEFEAKEGKEIRYTVMTRKDFEYRRQVKDRFINTVLSAKRQVLVDKHKLLETK